MKSTIVKYIALGFSENPDYFISVPDKYLIFFISDRDILGNKPEIAVKHDYKGNIVKEL
jgi:hypothetical protein